MSYCVNCGVELRISEKKCPLCGTVVLNPNRPEEAAFAEPAYPGQKSPPIDLTRKKGLSFFLLSMVLALPAAVCMAVNYVVNGGFSWSYYVLGSVGTFWVLFLLPFFLPKRSELLCLLLDYLTVNGLLYGIQRLAGPEKNWFPALGAPLVGVLAVGALLGILLFRARPSKFTAAAAICALLGVESAAFELITDRYLAQPAVLDWSLIALVVFLFAAVIFLLIGRKKRWKESIKKRIHI